MNQSTGAIPKQLQESHQQLLTMMRQGVSWSGFERYCFFVNTGSHDAGVERFADVSAGSGLDFLDDGRAISVVDWDHDGDLDLWVSNRNAPRLRFMRNNAPRTRGFLALRLEGDGSACNRDAIGARVRLLIDGPRATVPVRTDETFTPGEMPRQALFKSLRAGEGFLAQSSKWIHFGLDDARSVREAMVRWPDGQEETFVDLEPNHRYVLTRGSGRPRDLTTAARDLKLAVSTTPIAPVAVTSAIPMVALPILPDLVALGFDEKPMPVSLQADRQLFLTLWASWCLPCVGDLEQLRDRARDIQAAGIDVLALSVDGLGEDETKLSDTRRFIKRLKFPFTVARATPQLVDTLQQVHNQIFHTHRRLPLPTSFLIDGRGRLSVIYKGPFSVDDLLRDTGHGQLDRRERFRRSAPLAGRLVDDPHLERIDASADAGFYFRVGVWLKAIQGSHHRAKQSFHEAARLLPEFADAHYNLGVLSSEEHQDDEAQQHFNRVIEIDPAHAASLTAIGNLLEKRNDSIGAQMRYQQAIHADPTFAMAHYNLGLVQYRQERLSEAEQHFREAIRLDQDFSAAHNNLAGLLLRRGELHDAEHHYREALRLRPGNVHVQQNLEKVQKLLDKLQ